MSTSVGKITLELEIKTNLNKQMNSIKNQISKSIDKPMFDTAKNMSGNLSKAVDTVKNTVGKASKVISDEMSNTTGKVKDKSQEMSDEIRKAIGNFEISEDPTARLQQDLDNSKEKMSLLNAKWQELQSSLSKEDTDSGAAAVVEQLNLAERHMLDLQNTIDVTKEKLNSGIKMPELDIPAVDTDNLTESINGSTQSLNDLDVQADETGVGLKESVSKPTIDFKKLGSVVKSLGSGIKKGLSGAFNGLKAVGGKALDSLKKKLGGFKQLASGITGIFSKVGDVVKSAVIGACNSNDEFASSLNQIKANLQIAFVPIMQSIMPAINTLMAGVSQVTRVLATFTNQLFGSTYKKSLDTVKQIKDVGKEAKKNSTYLSSFDEMNVAQDNEKDNSSGGGGSGGIDYSAISGEEVELPDWAKRMKDSIKSGDWAGVGGLLAEKINKCFNIDWASIQSKVNGFITSVTSGLNGFMDKFDWAGLGSTIAGGINTVFGGMYTFMTTFDWSGLGKGIATSLNNAISKTDWGLIGKTFASKWNALIDTLFAFVTKFDFSGFGSSISKSVNAWFDEIDWAKLGKTITKSITGLLDTVLGFLETMDWAGIGESIQTFITNIDWIGIAKKVFEVIISALESAVELLWGFISTTVGSIGEWFDGLSPGMQVLVTVLAALTAGILAYNIAVGIMDLKTKLVTISKKASALAQTVLNAVLNLNPIGLVVAAIVALVAIFVVLWNKCDGFRNFIKKMWSGIKDVVSGLGEWFKEKFTALWNGIKSVFSKVGDFFSGIWTAIKKPFIAVADWFKDIFKKAWEGVKNVFSAGGKIFNGIKEGISGVFKTVVNGLIGGINKVISVPFKGINWALGKIKGISIAGFEPFKWIKTINTPEIPKLAKGGIAYAPTLAMVGDNKNATVDPEVVAPLSKLKGMLGDGENSETVGILKQILEMLRGLNIVFDGKINEQTLYRAIVRLNDDNTYRTGVNSLG